MNKIEIVKKVLSAIEQNNFDEVKKHLTDDFVFSGPVPKPADADTWLGLHKKMNQGVPDFSFNVTGLTESGNTVNGTVKISGTQTKNVPPLMPGIPAIPATNKKVQMPKEDFTFSFKGDKINKFTVEKVTDGGVPGFLKQLGINASALMGI